MRRQPARPSRPVFPRRPSVGRALARDKDDPPCPTPRSPHSPAVPSRGDSLSRFLLPRFFLTMYLFCSTVTRRWIKARPRRRNDRTHRRPPQRTGRFEKKGRSSVARSTPREKKGWRPSLLKRTRNRFGPFEATISPGVLQPCLPPFRDLRPGGSLETPFRSRI
jgi:hypothetical protein